MSVLLVQDELLAELEELEQMELDKNLLEIGGPENILLPNVPSTSLPSRPGSYYSGFVLMFQVFCLIFKVGWKLWFRMYLSMNKEFHIISLLSFYAFFIS